MEPRILNKVDGGWKCSQCGTVYDDRGDDGPWDCLACKRELEGESQGMWDTDAALWCHLYWLEEAWESWSTEAAGAESARDNLIASLDRAWGME